MADAARKRASEIAAEISSATAEEYAHLRERYADDPRRQVVDALGRAERRLAREEAERARVGRLYREMDEAAGGGVALGVDEVGRGAVAGPLTVCALALPSEPQVLGINDSKQLSPARREALAAEIERVALAIGIAHIEPAEIDERGMAASLRLAMTRAIEAANIEPDAVLIDGNPVHVHPKERNVVHGDARIACIAAASIVAKVTRDALMVELDALYPGYHLAACKGYASAAHIQAIRERGCSPIHRVSFCGGFVEEQRLF